MATLRLATPQGEVVLEMPGATTVRYAAKRAAEAMGYDPDALEFYLVDPSTKRVMPQDDVVAYLDSRAFLLASRVSSG